MREYARVSPRFWQSSPTGKAIRKKGAEAVVVAMYLMSSPHSNMLGLYYQPLLYMAHETGLGVEGASKGLQGCIEAGFCCFDEPSEMVWVHEMALYQVGEELKPGDKRCVGIQKDYDALPDCPYLGPFFDRYASVFHLKRKRSSEPAAADPVIPAKTPTADPQQDPPQAPLQAPSKPLRSQEQAQAQAQEQAQAAGVRGEVGRAFKRAGVDPMSFNLDDPRLMALLEQGATPAEFEGLAREAVTKGIRSPWGWVLKVLPERRAEAAALKLPAAPTAPEANPLAWADSRAEVLAMGANLGCGDWNEIDARYHGGESWSAYKARVVAAWEQEHGREAA
jgi:hypothetical protein